MHSLCISFALLLHFTCERVESYFWTPSNTCGTWYEASLIYMWNSIQICYILRIPELSQGLYLYAIVWYIYSMIHEKNWVLHICVMIWLCISISVKPSGFQNFLIKIDEPFIKLQIFYMHFLCISYALLMHFLCASYALFRSA